MDRRKLLATATLEGTIYAFVDKWSSRIQRRILVFRVDSKGFKAYRGMVSTSKVYSAFTRNNATILVSHLVKHGYRIDKAESVLRELKDFGVDFDVLPENVVSKLALAKLLEG